MTAKIIKIGYLQLVTKNGRRCEFELIVEGENLNSAAREGRDDDGSSITTLHTQDNPPVEEPPNAPKKAPVKEPPPEVPEREPPTKPPPPPNDTPIEEPPNEPAQPPVKKPPPKDPDRESPKPPVRAGSQDQSVKSRFFRLIRSIFKPRP
jgi:hypothetical protein